MADIAIRQRHRSDPPPFAGGSRAIAIGSISEVVTSSDVMDWTPRGFFGTRLLLLDGREVNLVETSSTDRDRADRWRILVTQRLQTMGWSPVPRTPVAIDTDGIRTDPLESIRSVRRAAVGPWVVKAGVHGDGFASITSQASTREVVNIGPVRGDLNAAVEDACQEILRLQAGPCQVDGDQGGHP
ncbi:MAG: hypothetical protein Q8M22_15905 [Actinomycetota bacterium]|nr:hypothetical protein [Actinomycetota bacterium]